MLPKAPDGFEWVDFDGRPALVCTALATIAPHFFTTRAWAIGAPGEANGHWDAVEKASGASRLLRLVQVHGVDLVVHRKGDPPPAAPPQADVIVTDDDRTAVAVQAADCVPLLVADCRQGVVAAAHAGWRGLASGVPQVAVEALASAFGSRSGDLMAAVGPSIGACCYEVGGEVRERFAGRFGERRTEHWFGSAPSAIPGNPTMAGVRAGRDGKWFFDGWAAAVDQLVDAGVPRGQIHAARLCTASHAETFCSYRRDGQAAGRIAGVIRPARRP